MGAFAEMKAQLLQLRRERELTLEKPARLCDKAQSKISAV